MERSLKGKTALVTGASRGVGRAIAERLAGDGGTVAVIYNASKSGADEAVAAIEKAGGTAFAIQADLVDPATVFLASDDDAASDVGGLAESLGLAPIKLCGLMESGCSCSAREQLGPADLPGPGQVRLMNMTCPPAGPHARTGGNAF